jgi:hypothetical protein
LRDLGLPVSDVLDFERPVDLPDGGTARAAFSTATFAAAAVPHGHVFMCRHHTPETVWLPELMAHPNGACRLVGLVAAVDDARAVATAYARLFAAGVVHERADGAEVHTGDAPIRFLDRAAMDEAYPGLAVSAAAYAALRLAVADLGTARRCVADAGVATHPTEAGFAVAPADASGAIVEFVAA